MSNEYNNPNAPLTPPRTAEPIDDLMIRDGEEVLELSQIHAARHHRCRKTGPDIPDRHRIRSIGPIDPPPSMPTVSRKYWTAMPCIR